MRPWVDEIVVDGVVVDRVRHPFRRLAHRPPSPAAAARRALIVAMVTGHRRAHSCQMKCAVSETAEAVGVSQKTVFAALAEHRRKHPTDLW